MTKKTSENTKSAAPKARNFDYVKKLKRALENQKKYTPDLDLTILAAAGCLTIIAKAIEDIKKNGVIDVRDTQYGKERMASPAVLIFQKASGEFTKYLKHLGLTISNIDLGDDSDALTDFDNYLDKA